MNTRLILDPVELDPMLTSTNANVNGNLCANPSATTNTSGWTATSSTLTRVTLGSGGAPAASGFAATNGFRLQGSTNGARAAYQFTTSLNVAYGASAWVYIASLTATSVELELINPVGIGGTEVFVTLTATNQWINVPIVANADGATWSFYVMQVGTGAVDVYFTNVIIARPGRIQIDATPWIGQTIDWGDAAIEAYMAEAARGQIPVDYRVPNRVITVPLLLQATDTLSFESVRATFQQKVGLLQREGGWIRRSSVLGPVFADVVSASLKLGGAGWQEELRGIDLEAQLTLETLPDWFGTEIDLGATTETALPEIRRVLTDIKGNYPARVRLRVKDLQGQAQAGLMWGVRSENYTTQNTAILAYEAEALTPLDAASVQTLTGSSGGGTNNVIRHNLLPAGLWMDVVSTTILTGTAAMTHTGSYRVWGRFYSTSATPPQVRFSWDIGDLINPVVNDAVSMPGPSAFYDLDLGPIRLDPAPLGMHRWQGVVQALAVLENDNIYVDRLWLVPVDEGYGVLRALSTSQVTLTLRDGFDQSAGALNGKALPVGSATWSTSGASGTDFQVSGSSNVSRSINVAEGDWGGRFAVETPTTFTDVQAHLVGSGFNDTSTGIPYSQGPFVAGLILRWVDANNWLFIGAITQISDINLGNARLAAYKNVAGTKTRIGSYVRGSSGGIWDRGANGPGLTLTWDAQALATGAFTATVVATNRYAGGTVTYTISGTDTALATGGALATGKVGFYHEQGESYSSLYETNYFNDFRVYTPSLSDAVIFPNRSVELRTEGMYRESNDGGYWGPVSQVTGSLPRLPPAGLEGRSTELFLKTSRGDLATRPDSGIDDISLQPLYRPCWLFVPEA